MRRKFAKITAVLLAVTTVVGCSANNGAGQESISETTENLKTEAEMEESTKWYVSDTPVEIKVFFRDRTDFPISNDMPTIKVIEERTNVRFKWETVPWDGVSETFNIMMASPNNMPDLIIHRNTEMIPYVERGAFAPLNSLIDEYTPNLQAIFEEMPDVKKASIFSDGEMYLFPQIASIPNELTYMIRKDWLEELNLDAPETLDDWVTVMKAFRDNDMNKNGIQDEIPYTFTGGFEGVNLFEAFGIDCGLNHNFFMEDGAIKYGPADPRMKEYLEFASMLYKEKLIDPEYLTMDTKLWESRISTGTSGITIGFSSRIDRFNNVLKAGNPNAELIGLLPPVGPLGKPQTRRQMSLVKEEGSTAIAVSSTKKVEIAKLFNYLYSEECQNLLNFGIEGETYTKDNEAITYTDAILKDSEGRAPADMLRKNGMAMDFPYRQDVRYENAFISDEVMNTRSAYAEYILPDMPKMKFTKEELDVINPIMSEITTFKEESLDAFLLGKKSIDEFDQYVEKLNSMDLQKVLDVYNDALERYNAN